MEEAKQKDLITKMFNYIKEKLNEYLKGMDDFEKLQEFMCKEGNLYDSEGKPTEEYKEWMTKVESYCKEHPQMEKSHNNTSEQENTAFAPEKYFDEIQKLRKEYHEAKDKDAWIKDYLDNDEEMIRIFNDMVDQETKNVQKSLDTTIENY